MSLRVFFTLFVVSGFFAHAISGAAAGASTDLVWESAVTGQSLSLTVLEPEPAAPHVTGPGAPPLPLVIYLQNLAAARVGREDDALILRDLRAAGHLVVTLDYKGHPRARVPFLNRELHQLRDDVQTRKLLGNRSIDLTRIFIVPAGSRLRRDVVYYRDKNRVLALDLIYPSQPAEPVGAVLEFSCDNRDRMGNGSLTSCSDTILDGQATEGFAVAMADHPMPAPYRGMDAMPDSAWKVKAAVRTLRAEGAAIGLNGRIVPIGFSRGSGMALMLVTTEGVSELEGGPGAHPRESSTVQGAVVMSGRFTYLDLRPDDPMLARYNKTWGKRASHLDVWRRQGALDYLTKAPAMPLFLTINEAESPDALHQMTVLRRRLAELGADEVFLMDREPRGHKVTLEPAILDAMNNYLHRQLAVSGAVGRQPERSPSPTH